MLPHSLVGARNLPLPRQAKRRSHKRKIQQSRKRFSAHHVQDENPGLLQDVSSDHLEQQIGETRMYLGQRQLPSHTEVQGWWGGGGLTNGFQAHRRRSAVPAAVQKAGFADLLGPQLS